jgi:DNA-binding NarL/FixJ family response regulator
MMDNSSINPTQKINVWIIDDNKSFCIVLSEALNRSQTVFCSHYFHSYRFALRDDLIEDIPPQVILLDIKMPIVNGLDAIIPLKKRIPKLSIIMLTSLDSGPEIKLAIQRGANGYLLKSSTSADIIRSIESVSEGGSIIDPHIVKRLMDVYTGHAQEEQVYNLSIREKEIVKLFAFGLSTEEISKQLNISFNTVNTHRRNIFSKLNVHSRHSLVVKAYKEGLMD